ncbi:putative bifunctional diguanylate cyclase/phosphodiesterase [Halarsenatibacter silvermanii]|uniref:EAL domain, c-di-GMP-specific phosphodiesterase class I (Or its enzymatically inactive variant) n=1 Tax=Halarsenatibacter silvermanii TaxID=321763 RepID=A0A1G9MTS1_9FIRM|nr:GGDEF domain-containing phosphodiesterase [Halarsenatibacter silvermanii]SDL77706.1 EAL domain, c-di-GMP-specific phosphodiesterase class I (or its enzymatically inactive variant) [Halarsenatibacter silvermanii]
MSFDDMRAQPDIETAGWYERALYSLSSYREDKNRLLALIIIGLSFLTALFLLIRFAGQSSLLSFILIFPVMLTGFFFKIRGGLLAGAAAALLLLAFHPQLSPAGLPVLFPSGSLWFFASSTITLLGFLTGAVLKSFDHRIKNLRKSSFYNPDSGLPNRAYLLDRLEKLMVSASRMQLLLIEIDNYPEIVSSIGHEKAGSFRRKAAETLRRNIQQKAEPAKKQDDLFEIYDIYEDKLAVILSVTSKKQLKSLSVEIEDLSQQTLYFDEIPLFLNISLGAACYSQKREECEIETGEKLLKNAYIALRRSREQAGKPIILTGQEARDSSARLHLLGDVKNALEKNQFKLNYQPKIDLETGRIISVEALIRWVRPSGEIVPPGEFIPRVEKTALINQLSFWVVSRASEHLLFLEKEGIDLNMAVNISPNNLLEETFLQDVDYALKEVGLSPERFDLELTETDLMREKTRGRNIINRLLERGYQFSLDDFGSGHSSLSYLKNLNFNYLKIDRSFVSDMAAERRIYEIVNTAITLGHELGSSVVAEGVENREDLKLLKGMDCDCVQGYYISRPLSLKKLLDFCQEWQPEDITDLSPARYEDLPENESGLSSAVGPVSDFSG